MIAFCDYVQLVDISLVICIVHDTAPSRWHLPEWLHAPVINWVTLYAGTRATSVPTRDLPSARFAAATRTTATRPRSPRRASSSVSSPWSLDLRLATCTNHVQRILHNISSTAKVLIIASWYDYWSIKANIRFVIVVRQLILCIEKMINWCVCFVAMYSLRLVRCFWMDVNYVDSEWNCFFRSLIPSTDLLIPFSIESLYAFVLRYSCCFDVNFRRLFFQCILWVLETRRFIYVVRIETFYAESYVRNYCAT